MKNIILSDETFQKLALKKYSESKGKVRTYDDVIAELLEASE